MEQSTDRHVATLAEPRLSKVCDVCQLASMSGPYEYHWERFSRIKSSALAGWRCCRLIVDAIETWLRHAHHRAYNTIHLGSGPLLDTLEVKLWWNPWGKEGRRNGRYVLNALVTLRWQAGRKNDTEDSTESVTLIIFAPHGMHEQAMTHQVVSTDRD
jgi:hypothetical protein